MINSTSKSKAGTNIWELGSLTVFSSTLGDFINGFTIVQGYHLWTLSPPAYSILSKVHSYYLWIYANIIEQGYHLLTCIDRARLPLLNLYYHLAMEDVVARALYSKTYKIIGTGEVTSGIGLHHKYKS